MKSRVVVLSFQMVAVKLYDDWIPGLFIEVGDSRVNKAILSKNSPFYCLWRRMKRNRMTDCVLAKSTQIVMPKKSSFKHP